MPAAASVTGGETARDVSISSHRHLRPMRALDALRDASLFTRPRAFFIGLMPAAFKRRVP